VKSLKSLPLILAGAGLMQVAAAQPPPSSATYFPMIGLTRGQTLQINVVAFPPDPCLAQMGFVSSAGNAVGPVSSVTLQPGQSASLSIAGGELATSFGQRVELMPQVLVNPNSPPGCQATAEVVDDLLGVTTVLAAGSSGYPANPVFGLAHLTVFQAARLNVAAYPPDPCNATISFVDGNGALIGNSQQTVQLASGQATFLDLPGLSLVSGLGQRASVRPVVTPIPGASAPNLCAVSAEIYETFTGATDVYWPPDPCDPATGTCAFP
jgi:hypothetical protein